MVDGLANGAVYLLAGIGLVLVFSVTRVVFMPFGDIAAFEAGRLPPTIGPIMTLTVLAVIAEIWRLVRAGESRGIPESIAGCGLLPMVPCAGLRRRAHRRAGVGPDPCIDPAGSADHAADRACPARGRRVRSPDRTKCARCAESPDHGYVLETGEVALSGESKALANDPLVRATYLGDGSDHECDRFRIQSADAA